MVRVAPVAVMLETVSFGAFEAAAMCMTTVSALVKLPHAEEPYLDRAVFAIDQSLLAGCCLSWSTLVIRSL